MDQLLEEGTGSDKQTETTVQVPIGNNATSLQIVARIWVNFCKICTFLIERYSFKLENDRTL